MTLDSEFVKQTNNLISKTLELYRGAGVSPQIDEVWKCENIGDFFMRVFLLERWLALH
uniref:Uncharacterized protein n=1 Tax=uncultured marine thaumarchaeote KM3_76_D06 TaxID=1456284 RepID=A0A075HLB7_9ARCH|nr:hypothetical protein [uncultured marine thaumarchaeote KM3_76_D06]